MICFRFNMSYLWHKQCEIRWSWSHLIFWDSWMRFFGRTCIHLAWWHIQTYICICRCTVYDIDVPSKIMCIYIYHLYFNIYFTPSGKHINLRLWKPNVKWMRCGVIYGCKHWFCVLLPHPFQRICLGNVQYLTYIHAKCVRGCTYIFSHHTICAHSIEIHMPANMFRTYTFEPSCDFIWDVFFGQKKLSPVSHQVLDSTELTGRSKSKSKGGPRGRWKIPPIRDVVGCSQADL